MMELVSITLSWARMGGVAGRSESGEAHVKKLKREEKLRKENSEAEAESRDRATE
jgi:hypothetical protein